MTSPNPGGHFMSPSRLDQTLLLVFLLCLPQIAQAADAENQRKETELLLAAAEMRLGDSALGVARKLEPSWISGKTNTFLTQGMFASWIPYTNRAAIVEWVSEVRGSQWPMIIFAVFSGPERTNLVDAFIYNGGEGVQPLVDGPYNRRLMAVKSGDSMEEVFAVLGKRECEYFRGREARWRVRALYMGRKGEFINIEADAATGKVLRVWDGAL